MHRSQCKLSAIVTSFSRSLAHVHRVGLTVVSKAEAFVAPLRIDNLVSFALGCSGNRQRDLRVTTVTGGGPRLIAAEPSSFSVPKTVGPRLHYVRDVSFGEAAPQV
jgi:hypothetical protein